MARSATDAQRGSGLLSTLFGVMAVMAFFFFAAQISLALYAKSVATAIAHDFARDVALLGRDRNPDAVESMRNDAMARLAGVQGQVDVVGSGCAADTVCVHLRATPPQLLGFAPGVSIDRVIRVRIEQAVP